MTDLFSLERFITVAHQIPPYFGVTIRIVLVAIVFGSLAGVLFAVLRIRKIPVIDQILSIYLSFMRGTPMVIQMMIVYYALPVFLSDIFGIEINGWEKITFVEITFVLNEAAFLGEIFRSAILAVPYQQTEAGYSVGMNSFQTFVRIVLPQAARIALPSYGVDIVGVFHNTSIAFILGVIDMIGRAQSIKASSGHALEAYLFIAIIFVVVSILIKSAFAKLDDKLSYGRG